MHTKIREIERRGKKAISTCNTKKEEKNGKRSLVEPINCKFNEAQKLLPTFSLTADLWNWWWILLFRIGYFTIHWKLRAHWWFPVWTVRFTSSPSSHELSLQKLSSEQLCKGDFCNTASHLVGLYVCCVLLGEEPQKILLVVSLCRLRAIQEGPFLPEYGFWRIFR